MKVECKKKSIFLFVSVYSKKMTSEPDQVIQSTQATVGEHTLFVLDELCRLHKPKNPDMILAELKNARIGFFETSFRGIITYAHDRIINH